MKLVVTLIKEKDNENIEPGEVISFNVSEEEANEINEAMSKNDFALLTERIQNLEDIHEKKHNIDVDDIYGFEFVL